LKNAAGDEDLGTLSQKKSKVSSPQFGGKAPNFVSLKSKDPFSNQSSRNFGFTQNAVSGLLMALRAVIKITYITLGFLRGEFPLSGVWGGAPL
jgi:hypothetical protein